MIIDQPNYKHKSEFVIQHVNVLINKTTTLHAFF